MHADLVRPSGLKPRFETREVSEPLEDAIVRDRAFAPTGRPDRHANAFVGMAADRRIHNALSLQNAAMRHCEIAPLHRSRRQLRGERIVGGLGLGDHE